MSDGFDAKMARAQVVPRNTLHGLGYTTQGAEVCKEVHAPGANAIGVMEETHKTAEALASRVIELSELLCGEAGPSCKGDVMPTGAVGGILPTIESNARDLKRYLDSAHDAITRIRNHLPS